MTLKETSTIMSILSAAYPQFYKNQTEDERGQALRLWAAMFAEDDVKIVVAAVKTLIVSDEKGYPPHIGAVKARIRQLIEPAEMTELEAWGLVARAVSQTDLNHPEKQFNKLPELIRQTLGSPNTLKEWGLVNTDSFNTVIQSNFLRSYRARSQSAKEYKMLPNDVKCLIGNITKPMLTEGREFE